MISPISLVTANRITSKASILSSHPSIFLGSS